MKLKTITERALKLNETIETAKDSCLVDIFELYKKSEEISAVLRDCENHENGFYFFNDFGDLSYGVQVPLKIANLPFINDFLTQDYFTIDQGHSGHNDLVLSQSCGPCITINWNCTGREYFIYDHDAGKAILETMPNIEGNEKITIEQYVAAKLELYQENLGQYSDIVEIDYYGGYNGHFDTFKALEGIERDTKTLTQLVELFENNEEN